MPELDLDALRALRTNTSRYSIQLSRLRGGGKDTALIEGAVAGAAQNVVSGSSHSFVIFGEPQSGKTEMMICLTAKLLDEGYDIIIHLLNDSVQLLEQNLDRFKRSGLAPAARNFTEVLDPDISLKTGQHVIFCKKNGKDLQKLLDKTHGIKKRVIVDDEADYATPNAKINVGEVTRINNLIRQLISSDGFYIGVTATPARLDLNNTLDNDSASWIWFAPHRDYTGQEQFFPLEEKVKYRLNLIRDDGDQPKFLREALFRFMVTVAYLNLHSTEPECNFSILIHTSGKKDDHKIDRKTIEAAFAPLIDSKSAKFGAYMSELAEIASTFYPNTSYQEIVKYIVVNASRYAIVVMNSDREKGTDFVSATKPATLFTIVVGGNIVSRGVTFDNLLSMYFSRSPKTKLQQDTYIQRARMFGSRGKYLEHFELTIPESLYQDWHRCFVFHKLALAAITDGKGSPIWLADNRISVAAPSSIDRARVEFDRGEMSFGMFDFSTQMDDIATDTTRNADEKLAALRTLLGDVGFPEYLLRYVKRVCPDGPASIAVHKSQSIKEGYSGADVEKIERKRGFLGSTQLKAPAYEKALHHFIIIRNPKNKARLFYKFQGSLQFIKNLRHDA
jgi:Z1 domain/Type III restriction enzyme, res subunit